MSAPTERAVQRSILKMAGQCFPRVLFHHSPNGAHLAGTGTARFKQAGALLGDGMRRGFPDLIALWPCQVAFLEVKRALGPRGGTNGSEVSDEQAAMIQMLSDMGHKVSIVRSPEQAFDLLKNWGAPWNGVPWVNA